jgi:FeS assembly SUF system regulator
MSYLAAHGDRAHNASELATGARLPVPTVSKLLRTLAREGLLESQRGVKGGYALARPADEISVAEIIVALEGPIALTACATVADPDCAHESLCPIRSHWNRISVAIRDALRGVSLAEMAAPMKPDFMSVRPNHLRGGQESPLGTV